MTYWETWKEQKREETRLKLVRREAIRPLRAMLDGTPFGIGLPHVSTGCVLIVLAVSWSRSIRWEDCGDRALVARLQREIADTASRWLDGVYAAIAAREET